MSFSDENLRNLKHVLDCQKSQIEINPGIFIDEIKALIMRLEAAEQVCNLIALNTGWSNHAAVEIWLKSAGRAE